MKISVAPLLRQPYGASERLDLGESPITSHGEHRALREIGVAHVVGDALFTHTNPGILVVGAVEATVELDCARCLDRFSRAVPVRFVDHYYATIDVATGAAQPPPPPDAYTIGHDFVIDVTPLLREHILLELPWKPLDRPDCLGLCPVCGRKQVGSLHEHAEPQDERWSELRELLTKLRNEEG